MLNIVKAEGAKMRHSFGGMVPFAAPAAMLLLALVLTGGLANAFPSGAWNWWYALMLSGSMAVWCSLSAAKDRKIGYQNMLLRPLSPFKSWMGKILFCGVELFISNLIMLMGTVAGGAFLGTAISPVNAALGAFLLSVCYLWQVPLFLFLGARFNLTVSVFAAVILSVTGIVGPADGVLWWIYPPCIPVRLMCPALKILPNGLPVPLGSELLSFSVILPGIALSLAWLAVLSLLTGLWFRRRESR